MVETLLRDNLTKKKIDAVLLDPFIRSLLIANKIINT